MRGRDHRSPPPANQREAVDLLAQVGIWTLGKANSIRMDTQQSFESPPGRALILGVRKKIPQSIAAWLQASVCGVDGEKT